MSLYTLINILNYFITVFSLAQTNADSFDVPKTTFHSAAKWICKWYVSKTVLHCNEHGWLKRSVPMCVSGYSTLSVEQELPTPFAFGLVTSDTNKHLIKIPLRNHLSSESPLEDARINKRAGFPHYPRYPN